MPPPPRITKAAVTAKVTPFVANLNRARDLYRKIVLHGYTHTAPANTVRLDQPDKRDVAQFIFFEVAAKFEDFAKAMFQAETRAKLSVTAARSVYVMGDPDNGLDSKMGWGSPQRLKERGENLFGKNSFFGDLETNISPATYKALVSAHVVRNRVAHAGGNAQAKFVKHLDGEGIAAAERQGMSVGRYLCDYPRAAPPANRHFYRFLAAYEGFATQAAAALP
jgi:hypothetical protein